MSRLEISIIFFGSGPVAAASLKFLANNFNVETVITKSKSPHYKGLPPVLELSNKLQLPVLFANNKNDLDNIFVKHPFTSEVGIIVDYGVMLSKTVIDYFKFGIVNSHFSMLPQWRGADPITYSVLSGQTKTGVSLMIIEPKLDTGKLITRKSLKINENETSISLTKRLIELSNSLLIEYLPKYIKDKVHPKNQPHPIRATYSKKIKKSDGEINWQKSSLQIEREIRAYLSWPGSNTSINGTKIIVKRAHVTDKYENILTVLCGDGNYLSIDELIAPSGKTMNANDFINGYMR